MTHQTEYDQQIDDCDFPLTATWTLEYQAIPGCPGDKTEPGEDSALEIVSCDLNEVWINLCGSMWFEVRIDYKNHGAAENGLRNRLDDELLMQACERHWERRGYDEELEAA